MFGSEEVKFEQCSHKEDITSAIAKFETTEGDFEVELLLDRAPIAAWNFINLAEGRQENVKNAPYYDGLIFHRVIAGFMAQAGCPNGMGTGGPGYEFVNENHPESSHDGEGVLAMANRGPDTNGSQFYITLAPTPHLDGGYTIFGKVKTGMETIKTIGSVETGNQDKPRTDIVINKVTIIR